MIYMFFVMEIECCFFCHIINYSDREYNKGNILLFSTNQTTDVLYVSNLPRWNSPCRGEGTYPPRSSIRVRQQGELT